MLSSLAHHLRTSGCRSAVYLGRAPVHTLIVSPFNLGLSGSLTLFIFYLSSNFADNFLKISPVFALAGINTDYDCTTAAALRMIFISNAWLIFSEKAVGQIWDLEFPKGMFFGNFFRGFRRKG